MVLLYVSANEALKAHAENALIQENAAGRHRFSVETGTAIYKAMSQERREAAEVAQVKPGEVFETLVGADDRGLVLRTTEAPSGAEKEKKTNRVLQIRGTRLGKATP